MNWYNSKYTLQLHGEHADGDGVPHPSHPSGDHQLVPAGQHYQGSPRYRHEVTRTAEVIAGKFF